MPFFWFSKIDPKRVKNGEFYSFTNFLHQFWLQRILILDAKLLVHYILGLIDLDKLHCKNLWTALTPEPVFRLNLIFAWWKLKNRSWWYNSQMLSIMFPPVRFRILWSFVIPEAVWGFDLVSLSICASVSSCNYWNWIRKFPRFWSHRLGGSSNFEWTKKLAWC